jgi:hypothetical protein
MLLTYGVSPAGAEQSALGQPVTNPADRLIVDQLKAAIQQANTSVSDAVILRQRIAAPENKSMHIASAKQRAECVKLLERVKELTEKNRILIGKILAERSQLGILERTPAQPGDARYETWKAERLRLKNGISSLAFELQISRNSESNSRHSYNTNCGGRLPPIAPNPLEPT